jgi:Putative DNA-binding domain
MRHPLLGSSMSAVQEADLERLVENCVPEDDHLDYKRDGNFDATEGKKEFVKDVVSFANAGGGLIIYGMDEERVEGQPSGLPAALVGMDVPNEDALLRQCRSMLDDSVDERISGIEMRAVRLANGRAAFLVRVPRSLQAPHQVTRDRDFRFYGRNGAQRSLLTRSQVRELVLRNADRYEAIRLQHLRRLATYREGRPVGFWMLHIIPLVPQPDAFDLADAETVRRLQQTLAPPAYGAASFSFRHRLDGYEAYTEERPNYTLLLRDGSLEFVEQFALRQDARQIPAIQVERDLSASFDLARALYAEGALAMPFVLCFSMEGLGNKVIGTARDLRPVPVSQIDFDPIIVSEASVGAPALMRGWMNLLWQSAGWRRALTYNDDGSWTGATR